MKKFLLPICSILLLASCSAPKYAYHFDHYNYQSGKKKVVAPVSEPTATESPLAISEQTLVASADEKAVTLPTESELMKSKELIAKKYNEMSKTERKEFRKEAIHQVKAYIKAKKSGQSEEAVAATKGMDHDLKLAAIFGAVGVVSLIIGGDAFWIIGGIALLIGVVFFVMWLIRQ